MDAASKKIFRFGVFEADTSSGELHKAGMRLRLQEQPRSKSTSRKGHLLRLCKTNNIHPQKSDVELRGDGLLLCLEIRRINGRIIQNFVHGHIPFILLHRAVLQLLGVMQIVMPR